MNYKNNIKWSYTQINILHKYTNIDGIEIDIEEQYKHE